MENQQKINKKYMRIYRKSIEINENLLESIKNHDQIMKICYILYKNNENQKKIMKININLKKINRKSIESL